MSDLYVSYVYKNDDKNGYGYAYLDNTKEPKSFDNIKIISDKISHLEGLNKIIIINWKVLENDTSK